MQHSNSENTMGTVLALPQGFAASRTGLSIDPAVSFEARDQAAQALAEAERRAELQHGQIHWWIGDLLGASLDDEAVQLSNHFSIQTARNDRYVAAHIPPAVRREGLPFGHHAAVAGLPPDMQDQLLAQAEERRLTRADLREAVSEIRHNATPLVERVHTRLTNALAAAVEVRELWAALSQADQERLAPMAEKVGEIYRGLL